MQNNLVVTDDEWNRKEDKYDKDKKHNANRGRCIGGLELQLEGRVAARAGARAYTVGD